METRVGSFVKISGLTSDTGLTMNGKIAIARAMQSDRGRVEVEVLGVKGGKPGPYRPGVAIKNSNLEVVPGEDGYKLLEGYLINKMYDAKDNKVRLGALEEIFDIPGFTATWRENATMVSLLRINDRAQEAFPYSEKCVEEIPSNHPERNKILYDYALCLNQDGQLQKALDMALKIAPRNNKYDKQIKLELLNIISSSCGTYGRDAIKEPALRALMEIVREERKGSVAWDLGAALCRQHYFGEGVKFYEQAIASGINEPSLKSALALARAQAASEDGVVLASLPNAAGGRTPVFCKQI